MTRAIILLSGGLDSATAAAIAKSEGCELFALTIDYGQRHRIEIEAAKRVAEHIGIAEHVILPVDFRLFGGSSLTDDIEVPKDVPLEQIGKNIPNTYVPARNTVFLSLALAYAESVGAEKIYIGISNVDYSGYPDCRPEFLQAFSTLARWATKAGIEGSTISIEAPLLSLTKRETILRGMGLGVDYSLTFTCYDPSPEGKSCGRCESCLLRQAAFREAGVPDVAENPFSTKFWASGTIPFLFSQRSENFDTLLEKMRHHPICQIVGPHGSGKSTLLLELLKRYEKNKDGITKDNVRYLFFNDQQRHVPGDLTFRDSFFFVDGFEQLPITDQLRFLFRSKRLILTAHRPVWFVPVLYRTQPQFSVFVEIVRQLATDSPEESVLRTVYERSGGNFRNAFFELYDQWERNQ
jgi:7-cyano-7-deazaguanine synthase